MSRTLSNPEWAAFLSDVDVNALGLPPWGGVVDWHGQLVLVYIAPGGVYLTDVSDRRDVLANVPKTWDPNSTSWWYHLPEETIGALIGEASEAAHFVTVTTEEVANLVGQTASNIAKPLLQDLTIPLVIIGALGLLYLTKR